MRVKELIAKLEKIATTRPDDEIVLDVDEDSLRHLNICEVIPGDKVIIIAADLSCN